MVPMAVQVEPWNLAVSRGIWLLWCKHHSDRLHRAGLWSRAQSWLGSWSSKPSVMFSADRVFPTAQGGIFPNLEGNGGCCLSAQGCCHLKGETTAALDAATHSSQLECVRCSRHRPKLPNLEVAWEFGVLQPQNSESMDKMQSNNDRLSTFCWFNFLTKISLYLVESGSVFDFDCRFGLLAQLVGL